MDVATGFYLNCFTSKNLSFSLLFAPNVIRLHRYVYQCCVPYKEKCFIAILKYNFIQNMDDVLSVC